MLAAPRTSSVVRGGAAVSLGGKGASPRTARELVQAIVARRYRSPFGFCVWCGAPCYGRECRGHDDLTLLEQDGWAA